MFTINNIKIKFMYGFSLIEFSISLVIIMFIMSIILQQYYIHRINYDHTQVVLDRFYDVILISEKLRTSIKHAGFTPCTSSTLLQSDELALQQPLQFNNTKNSTLNISRMADNFINSAHDINHEKIMIVDNHRHFHIDEKILITDCIHGELRIIKNIEKINTELLILTLNNALNFNYLAENYVGEWITESFFIRNKNNHKVLYYKYHNKAEILSTNIHNIVTAIIKKNLYKVKLFFNANKKITVITAIH